jgi:hypothetical protein
MTLHKPGFIMDQYNKKLEIPTVFDGSLPYQIYTKFVEWLMGHMEKSIYGLM